MITFKQYISEAIDNLFLSDVDKRKEYVDQVWDILQNSYAKIGGIHGKGFSSKEEMISDIPFWKIFRRGNEVKAVFLYKDKSGRKSVAMGTDGSAEAKKIAGKIKAEELTTGRSYMEVSDAALFFLIKQLKFKIIDHIIPYKEAVKRAEENGDPVEPKSLKDEAQFIDEIIEFFNNKDSHKLGMTQKDQLKTIEVLTAACYRRMIGKHFHTKVMVGNIDAPNIKEQS